MFKDDKITVYPIEILNDQGKSCFSYICQPVQGNRTFLPKKAKAIKGLLPNRHYKLLTDGQSVTLEDGSIVTPEMVCEPPLPAQCFAFIFLPDISYLKNFCDNFENTMFRTFSVDQIN